MKRLFAALPLALLLAPLLAPQGLALLGLSEGEKAVENRRMTPMPPASLALADFSAYAAQAAKAYTETFPFRDDCIRLGNRLKMAVLGGSPSRNVILGDDGWMFYNMELSMEDWLNVMPYSGEELDHMAAVMRARREWLGARGIAMLLVVAPNKETVYGEHLPASYEKAGPVSRLDRLGQAMAEAGIPFLDLRQALFEAKKARRCYWKTDTHWNGWGAFAGSRAIVDALRARFPAMPPLREEDYQVVERTVPGGDLAELLLMEKTFTEDLVDMAPLSPARARPAGFKGWKEPADIPARATIVRETGNPSLPRAVFLRDSFASAAWPFLAERFSRAVFIWDRRFLKEIIEKEKPDVVVFQAVERYQHAVVPPPGYPGD